MRLSDLLLRDSVIVPLRAESREEAIRLLAHASALPSACQDELELAALARERGGSSGIGSGMALPHGACDHIAAPILACGRAAAAIDFKSSDGEPATLLFLLAVPKKRFYCHLYPLSALSLLPSDRRLLARLNAAPSVDEFFKLIAGMPV